MIVWHLSADQLEDEPDPDRPLPREPRCPRAFSNRGERATVQQFSPAQERGECTEQLCDETPKCLCSLSFFANFLFTPNVFSFFFVKYCDNLQFSLSRNRHCCTIVTNIL